MEIKIQNAILTLIQGDITAEETDAIVNAANAGLRGGGGVDGAIHRAGGPAIMEESRKIGSCPPGQAVITTGGNLKARFVIHAVGPIYRGGQQGEATLLASAYRESLKLAALHRLESIAFPAISAGAYGYPLRDAARIALDTACAYLKEHNVIKRVRFVLYDRITYDAFAGELQRICPQR